MNHTLRIEKQYLVNLMLGRKKCEVRYNDRDYQLGDVLEFYDSEKEEDVRFTITHIHSGLGLQDGYVVLSVEALI